MTQQIILGIGTGRCGTGSLAKILNLQAEAVCSFEEPPLLPWKVTNAQHVIRERFARFRHHGKARLLGDCAPFYLPYLEEAIALEPDIRIVCLRRPREEVVASFCQWLDQTMPLPTNHWAQRPAPGWHHDPLRTRTFPQYETQDREEGIRCYWNEYHRWVDELIERYPKNIRLFDTYKTLNTEDGQRDLLSFVSIPPEQQVLEVGTRVEGPPPSDRRRRPRPHPPSNNPMDPRRCAILVPFASSIMPPCERALQELERRGYHVRRVGGYAAIDQGRNQMATDALLDGFEETMWIDADIDFHPNAIDQLRSHRLPIVAGIYPQKGKRALASHVIPDSSQIVFGKEGGLVEILYAGAGFLLVRREVYMAVQERLPMCNERFRVPLIPLFHPMLHPCEDGHWYLAEDYAFCERVRQCGFKIMADTTIRLWHIGNHSYGWEDAGMERERFDTFTLNLGPRPDLAQAKVGDENPALTNFASQHSWPSEKPRTTPVLSDREFPFKVSAFFSESVTPSTRLIIEIGSQTGHSTRNLANLATQATIIALDRWHDSPELQPSLYETFLSECWEDRQQIIPLKAEVKEGLQRIFDADLQPDFIYLNSNHDLECIADILQVATRLFPKSTIFGNDWDQDSTRSAVETFTQNNDFQYESQGQAWRIVR